MTTTKSYEHGEISNLSTEKHRTTSVLCFSIIIITMSYSVPVNAVLSFNVKLGIIHSFYQQYCYRSMILLDIFGETSGTLKTQNDNELVRFMSQEYALVTVSSVYEWKSCMVLPDSAGRKPLFVLSYDGSSQHDNFLKQVRQFNNKNIWLLVSSWTNLTHLLQVLSELNISFNSNVFVITHDEINGIQLSEIYVLGPNYGLHQDVITTWGIEDTNITFPKLPYKYSKPGRRSNMQAYKLTATALSANEFFTNIKKIGSEFQIVGGYFGETFKNVAQDLNFTYTIKFHSGYAYGSPLTRNNLAWTGIIGDIERGEANLSACEVSFVGDRLKFMDFTISILMTVRHLYIHEGLKELQMDSYFHPFGTSIWIALIVALFLFTAINTVLYKVIRTQKRLGILSNLFVIISLLLMKGTYHPENTPIRMVLQTYAMLFLVMYTAYSAKLTALTMLYKPPLPIQNISDIFKSSSWKFGLINGSLEYNAFRDAERNSIQGQLWHHKLLPYPENIMSDYEAGLLQVLVDDHFVFMGLEHSCLHILQNSFTPEQACKVVALRKAYFIGGMTLALQKNSPYKQIINYSLMKMKSCGILNRLKLKWIPQPIKCSKLSWIVTDWLDIVPPITGYCTILTVSICILIGELLLDNYLKRNTLHKNKQCKTQQVSNVKEHITNCN